MQAQRVQKAPSQRRFVTIALVVAIHVAAIYALIVALNPHFALGPIRDPVIDVLPPRTLPPPPQPPIPTQNTFRIRGVSDPLPPRVDIDSNPTSGAPPIPRGPIAYNGPQAIPTLTPVRPIFGTHSTPDYPPIAARLNEQGSVRLQLGIDEQGAITDASVITSSGYEALDRAAIAWVKAHWRYAPAMRDGVPIPASTSAVVTFRLTNRQS